MAMVFRMLANPALPNVTVHLYASDGKTLLQSTTTDSNGNYSFISRLILKYVIKLDNAANYSTGPLKGYALTPANQDNSHMGIDSKATLPISGTTIGNNNFPQIRVSDAYAGPKRL